LVKSAEVWLFEHQYVLPGDRFLRDQARLAFAAQDAASIAAVLAGQERGLQSNKVA
jgi:hypothetical protein